MKKSILTLCVIMLTAVSAFASGGDETTKYLTPSFKQGWFVDLAGTYSIMASTGSIYHNISTYYGGFNSNAALKQHQFGFSAKVGRRVSPSVAIRVGYDRHKASNIDGKDFRFKSYHLDVMESPLDFFFGYNPERLYTMWVYGGVGMIAWDPMATHKYNLLIHVLDGKSNIDLGFHGGIMNNFRLSNSLDLHIDLTAVAAKWSFDTDTYDNNPSAHNAQGYARWHRAHFDFSGMVGLMWYLGGRELTPAAEAVEADCSEQEKTIAALNDEIARLRRLIESNNDGGGDTGNNGNNGNNVNNGQETDTVVKVLDGKTLVTYPFSVFFNKGSYELRDGRDRVNLQAIAKVAKDYNLKLNLRGTCDSGTGTPAFNKTLAENRCNKIKAELKKLGIDEKNITIEAGGGVKELTPAEYDRRVVITLSK